MRTALAGGEKSDDTGDTDVASDTDANKDADQNTTLNDKEAAELAAELQKNTASPSVIAKAMHTALYGDGVLSGIWRYVNDDEEGFMTAFKKIKDGAQLKAVESEFQKLSDGLDIRGAVAQEMREKSAEVKKIYAELKNKSGGGGGGDVSSTNTSSQDNNPNADAKSTTQDVNIGDGNWARVSKELGYANQSEFVNYHLSNGTAEMKDILKNPSKYSKNSVKLLKNPNHDGSTVGSAKASSSDAGAGADKSSVGATAKTTVAPVEPRPGKNFLGGDIKGLRWDKQYGATHNPDGSPKNENKEYDMTKKVNEAASMNISMTGDNSTEVADLVALLRNAGMEKAEPVNDMPMYKDKHDDMVSKIQMMDPKGPMDSPSPCGMGEEDVGEEWDNSPDEEYKDDDYMTRDIAGGLNRPKPPGALRAKDPAIHNEDVDKYKSELRKGLQDLYKTI